MWMVVLGLAFAGSTEARIGGQGAWTLKTDATPDGRHVDMTATLDADAPVSGWPDKEATPQLVLECQRRKLYAYIRTGLTPDASGAVIDPFVAFASVRLGQGAWEKVGFRRGVTNEQLYFPKAKSWLVRMRDVSQVGFEFTPFASPAAATTFTLEGYEAVLEAVQRSCGKKTRPVQYDL